MYQKGELRLITPPCKDHKKQHFCDHGHHHEVTDSRTDHFDIIEFGVCLPHSCDEWVIGGPDEIRALVEDLKDALKQLEVV